MTTLELKLSLPNRLPEEAQAAGLLTPEAIESMLRETLRPQHVEELRQATATLAGAEIPPLPIEESDEGPKKSPIQAEDSHDCHPTASGSTLQNSYTLLVL